MFKIGDKVKIKGKSIYNNWHIHHSNYLLNNEYIGYISKINGDGSGKDDYNCLVVENKPNTNTGNFFAPQDLELIEEKFKIEDKVKYDMGYSLENLKLVYNDESA